MVVYSFVIFAIMQAPPGDFLTAYVATLASSGSSMSAEQIAAMRRQYGLDQPFVVKYLVWLAAPAARRLWPVARVPAADAS
jgi:peptide/nickel transport system permease protein